MERLRPRANIRENSLMEVIRNATETVSPLTYLRGRKENLLVELDEENRRTQDIIRTQNTKRQEVLIFLVLAAFSALSSCLIVMARYSNTIISKIYLPLFFATVILSIVFLVIAVAKYPASVKYQGTWNNIKEAKSYEQVLKESLEARKKTKEAIAKLNSQLQQMDDKLTVSDIPEDDQM